MTALEEMWTRDHHGLYLEGKHFYPLISDSLNSWSNAVVIDLSASLASDLNWTSAKNRAEQVVASGKWIVWNLDLDFSSLTFFPNDTTTFQSLWLSIEQFCKEILPIWEKNTLGVIIYQGNMDITPLFPKNWWEPFFLENYKQSDSYLLFAMQLFSEYVHRLVSVFPVSVFPFLFFDARSIPSLSTVAHLLFHERFEHMVLGLKGDFPRLPVLGWDSVCGNFGYRGDQEMGVFAKTRAKTAILLPEDRFWSPAFFQTFDLLVKQFQEEQREFCLIAVKKLHEEWDGIDEIYIPLREAISEQTVRKLQGFEATGGVVIMGEKS